MVRLNIELPDELGKRLEAKAAESGHATVEGYVQTLLRADAGEGDYDRSAPRRVHIRSAEDLESKLLEGVASGPATEMTTEDWESIRREVAGRKVERAGVPGRSRRDRT